MPQPRTVKIGQTIQLIDGEHTLAGYGAGVYKVRNNLTGEYELMDPFELSRRLAPGESAMSADDEVDTTIPLAAALDALTEQDRRLIPHLKELIDGTPAIGDEPNDDYAPAEPMVRKLERKSRQLREIGMNVSVSTLKRKIRQFENGGPAALMRKQRREPALNRVEEEVLTALREVLNTRTKGSTLTKSAVYALLERKLQADFPSASDRPKMPSVASINRYILEMDGDTGVTTSARTRRTKRLSPKSQFTPRRVTAPGDETQIDSTMFDAFVRMPNGDIRRPWLTLLVDKRTRSIVGFNFTASNPRTADHAVLIARALVPRMRRPWAKKYTVLNLPEMPWAKHLTDEQRAVYDTHRPYIFPRTILSDNGKDFTSIDYHGVCGRYGIHPLEAPLDEPTAKAHVERMFRTVREMFAQFLPGYTGGNTDLRGDEPEAESVLSLEEVEELFDRWVAIVWQNRYHDSLHDRFDPKRRHTPNTMYAAAIETTGHFFVPVDPMDYLRLLPRERRNVHPKGIEMFTKVFDSPRLAPLRNHTGPDGDKTLFGVHYDPADMSRVWLHDHFDDEWIICERVDADGHDRPHESALLAKAHRLHLETTGFTNKQANSLLLGLMDDVTADTEAAEQRALKDALARAERKQVEAESAPMSRQHLAFEDTSDISAEDEDGLELL